MVTRSCERCQPAPEDVATSSTVDRVDRLKMVDERIATLRNDLAMLLTSTDSSIMADTLHSGYLNSLRLSPPTGETEEEMMVRALGSADEADDDSRPPTRM